MVRVARESGPASRFAGAAKPDRRSWPQETQEDAKRDFFRWWRGPLVRVSLSWPQTGFFAWFCVFCGNSNLEFGLNSNSEVGRKKRKKTQKLGRGLGNGLRIGGERWVGRGGLDIGMSSYGGDFGRGNRDCELGPDFISSTFRYA